MDQPLLSICIPTYNRMGCLKQCLDSIISQFGDKEVCSQVEVVISDNASTDNTTEMVKGLQTRFNNIKYFRFDKNMGVDKNILNMVEKSTGYYCFSIGDDDAFFPGSFALMLDRIKTLKLPYYMINSWGYDHELVHPVLSHPNVQVKEDKVFESLTDHVRSIKKYIDLVGAFCGLSHLFRRIDWVSLPNKEQYLGTQAVHFFTILTVFKNTKCAFIAEPLIKVRSSNIRWDVFPGLETAEKRAEETIKGAKWVRDTFNLPISDLQFKFYFFVREYWFTFKETVKITLSKFGFAGIITVYRKLR